MAPETPQQGESGTESSRMMGTSSNMPPAVTQLQRRHHFAHRNTANAATRYLTLDAQLKIVCESRNSKKKTQHVIRCQYSRIEVNGSQLLI